MSVSVIVPVLNESHTIGAALERLREQGADEIIVVDGGSDDDTLRQCGMADRVLVSAPGRAVQMNAGALAARGDILLFLHADCQLDLGALPAVERRLANSRVFAGCFTMRVDAEDWRFRSIDFFATARVRWTGIIYGDQGLFLRRADFEKLGGFPDVRFMEDVVFSQRLRSRGRLVVLPQSIWVSPRRWRRTGLIRQTLRNWALVSLATLGVHPDRLADYYPRVR